MGNGAGIKLREPAAVASENRRRTPKMSARPIKYFRTGQLRDVMDNPGSSFFVGVLNLDGTVRYVNRAVLNAVDLEAHALIGKPLENTPWMSTSEVNRRRLRSAIRAAAAGSGCQFDLAAPDGTGRSLTLNFSLELVRDKNEDNSFLIVSAHDVTQQRQVERSLRATQVAVDHAQDAFLQISAAGEIQYVNDSACRLFGYQREELLAVRVFELDTDLPHHKWPEWWKELKSRGTLQMQRFARHKDGRRRIPVALLATHIEHDGWECASLHLVDLSERLATEECVRRAANYDVLTGLLNRCRLRDLLEQRLRTNVESTSELILLAIGLDRLRLINDSLGQPGADQVLAEVGRRLTRCAGEAALVGRLAEDEFAIAVTSERPAVAYTAELADCILAALSNPVRAGDEDVYVTCRIGVATSSGGGETAEDLMANAGIALREVGRETGGPTRIFSQRSRIRDRERLRLEADLHRAIERGEFVLFYQPRVDARFGKIRRLEALIRWPRPDGSWVAPGRFIPIAEETALIHPIGTWALRSAMAQAKIWQDRIGSTVGVSVNLSARQFREPDLVRSVARLFDATGLEPRRLELELTETMLIADVEEAIRSMRALKALGIRLSLDDFGTGYSSLSYLSRFPIDTLKIDQVFVRRMATDEASIAIVDSIIAIAHRLGLSVTAEGVENEGQLVMLRERGCDEIQGFLIARPMPVALLHPLLDASGPLLSVAITG
jgi:diguanylate cyclase (GGDEF)-like protein/PAS domain S-box-containing protein